MDLKSTNDKQLIQMIKAKVQVERKVLLEIIELLRELYVRRVHLKRGFSSLYEFCVKELGYSEGAAFRRIKAMKLVEDLPQVAQSIESGNLNLSVASQLQSVFEAKAKDKAPLSLEEKSSLFLQVQNQSRREAERTMAKIYPEVISTPEKIRPVGESQVKVELVIEGELFAKIEKLKNLTSHKNKSLIDLLESLVDKELKRIDPERKTSPAKSNISREESKNTTETQSSKQDTHEIQKSEPLRSNKKPTQSRYIPSALKHYIWMRAKGQCTFLDPITKRKCESKHKLQFEHIVPFAMGGETTANNLRLLCSNHNALTAITAYGNSKIQKFLPKNFNS